MSAATGVPIPPNYPVVGRDAFRTATGVHAAAVIKAFRKKDQALVDAVYSGVPASLVGREQEIEVGPMSGKSNVVFWLEKRGLPVTDEIVERIFAKAKASTAVLEEAEIRALCLARVYSATCRSLDRAEPARRCSRISVLGGDGLGTPRSLKCSAPSSRSRTRRLRLEQPLLDLRERGEQHVADRLQDSARDLVERVVRRCARRGSRGR